MKKWRKKEKNHKEKWWKNREAQMKNDEQERKNHEKWWKRDGKTMNNDEK